MCSIVASMVGVWLLAGCVFLRLEIANTKAPEVSRLKGKDERAY